MGAGGQSRYLIISLSSTLLLRQCAEHGALLFTCGWLGALCGNFKVGEGLVAALELSYSYCSYGNELRKHWSFWAEGGQAQWGR